MTLKALGYIGIRSPKTQDWSAFATDLLGMQEVDGAAGSRAFRMDDRKQRLLVTDESDGGEEGLDFTGGRSTAPRTWTGLPGGWKTRACR